MAILINKTFKGKKIILSLVLSVSMFSGMFTTAILTSISAWNEFLFSLVFNTQDLMRTVSVGISMFSGEHSLPWGDIAAASVGGYSSAYNNGSNIPKKNNIWFNSRSSKILIIKLSFIKQYLRINQQFIRSS